MHESECSVPGFLRALIPLESAQQRLACKLHDLAYEVGGTRTQRLHEDLTFGLRLLTAEMHPDLAEQYYYNVRAWGHLAWNGDDGPGARPIEPPDVNEAP